MLLREEITDHDHIDPNTELDLKQRENRGNVDLMLKDQNLSIYRSEPLKNT